MKKKLKVVLNLGRFVFMVLKKRLRSMQQIVIVKLHREPFDILLNVLFALFTYIIDTLYFSFFRFFYLLELLWSMEWL